MVGVTGGYCAGKDTAVRALTREGYPAIDVDAVGHRVLGDLVDRVADAFGPGVLGAGGQVDRRALAKIVFRDRRRLAQLEAILHPRMREIVAGEVERAGRRCVINAAVLYRMGLHELCDVVLCVRAPLPVRLARARTRDGMRAAAAMRRMWAQRGICLRPRGARVDTYSVRNAGTKEALTRAVVALFDALER